MLNRNSKKLPKEDILSIKKTGKRLRNGYALTKLKRWKKEYAERKLRSTTKAEEPKKTYAMNTERLKRAKQTIARRKRSKSMEERREYWRKKKVSGEKKGVKGEKKTKMVISPKRAMPSKQAISKAKSGGEKKVGEKVGVKGEKRQISPNRTMPTEEPKKALAINPKLISDTNTFSFYNVSSMYNGFTDVFYKGQRIAILNGRYAPLQLTVKNGSNIPVKVINQLEKLVIKMIKQTNSMAKSGGEKKVGEKVGVKGEKREVTPRRAMPIQNRAMVNKQIVEKIKQIEKPVEIEQIEKPVEIKQIEKPVEIEQIEKPTIKEIAKESKGKVIVASLPKFTKEKIEKFKEIEKSIEDVKGESTKDSYKLIENIVYNGNGLGNDAVNKFFNYISNMKVFSYTKFDDVVHIVEKYRDEEEVGENDSDALIVILLCYFLYQKLIKAPANINDIFKSIKNKNDLDILIPIFANNRTIIPANKKKLDNLHYKTLWDLTKKIRSINYDAIYSNKEDIVITNGFVLLIMSKNYLKPEIKNLLGENRKSYSEDMTESTIGFVKYEAVLPDPNSVIFVECRVKEEIEKCKLIIKLSKYVEKTILTKIIDLRDNIYCSVSYDAKYMLPLLEIYEKLGINLVNLKVQNVFDPITSDFVSNNLKTTKKAIIIQPLDSLHYLYALLMPVRIDFPSKIDISYNNKYGREYFNSNGLSDNIDYTSEVQEIANDVPAFGDLFSDIDYSNEVQEIANDVPAFGDDISEEKIELDTEYDLPDVPIKRDDTKIASSKDIRAMKFKQMMLPSKYKSLLGKVPENFRLLLWGAPGHGKSSLALTIANDIGKRVKTLYVSAEESLESATLSSRIKRFKATSRNLMFNDTNNPEIIEKIIMTFNPKFIVIDSVNVILGKTESIINLMLKYPNIGFIIIAQATKDRKRYAGLGSLAHAVDIVVNVKDGLATAEKNRYAQLGSMVVKGIKI